jgi:L-histidine N-alpha-methyltransferase
VEQATAIAAALAERREFPYEYTYLGEGSRHWREQADRSELSDPTAIDQTPWLVAHHAADLVALLPADHAVRVVDLGPGTGASVHGLLDHLVRADRLDSYLALDISAEILDVAGQRLLAAFPTVADRFHLHRGDFAGAGLDRVMTPDPRGRVRVVMMAGSTLHNLDDPDLLLRRIVARVGAADLLVLTLRVEPPAGRPAFMDRLHTGRPLKPQQQVGLDLCGIDRLWYDTELGYDPVRRELFTRVRLLRPVEIVFDLGATDRTVRLAAGDTVTVWRYRYLAVAELESELERAGWTVRLRATASPAQRNPAAAGDQLLIAAGRAV